AVGFEQLTHRFEQPCFRGRVDIEKNVLGRQQLGDLVHRMSKVRQVPVRTGRDGVAIEATTLSSGATERKPAGGQLADGPPSAREWSQYNRLESVVYGSGDCRWYSRAGLIGGNFALDRRAVVSM